MREIDELAGPRGLAIQGDSRAKQNVVRMNLGVRLRKVKR